MEVTATPSICCDNNQKYQYSASVSLTFPTEFMAGTLNSLTGPAPPQALSPSQLRWQGPPSLFPTLAKGWGFPLLSPTPGSTPSHTLPGNSTGSPSKDLDFKAPGGVSPQMGPTHYLEIQS